MRKLLTYSFVISVAVLGIYACSDNQKQETVSAQGIESDVAFEDLNSEIQEINLSMFVDKQFEVEEKERGEDFGDGLQLL